MLMPPDLVRYNNLLGDFCTCGNLKTDGTSSHSNVISPNFGGSKKLPFFESDNNV